MWLYFWLSNTHFALELASALICFITGWLVFDTFRIQKETRTALRSVGFFLLAGYFLVHGINAEADWLVILALVLPIIGYGLILISLLMEPRPRIPSLGVVLVLPAISVISSWAFAITTIILVVIVALSYRQYKPRLEMSYKWFFYAFIFLAISSALYAYNVADPTRTFEPLWYIEHGAKLIAFVSLFLWDWQYLKLRMKEELLLIFVSMALSIAIIVTFTFSALLLSKVEYDANKNLASQVRVLNYAVDRMKEQSRSAALVVAKNDKLIAAVKSNDFATIEEIAIASMKDLGTSFLTIADNSGTVILRAHSVTAKGDTVAKETAASAALKGNLVASVEPTETEKFSIRGAAPIYADGKLVGVDLTGFIVDNNLVDRIKRITGLDATVYDGGTIVATSYVNPDGKSRSVGTKQTDAAINETVLVKGESYVGRVTILNRPYLAAFIPIKNTGGAIVGMLSVAKPQSEVLAAATATNQLTLFVSMIIMVITILPAYIIAKNISEQ